MVVCRNKSILAVLSRLVSLPELPRGIVVNAFNCLSLEAISELPLQASPTSRPQRFNLAKCSKLNLSEILHKESGRKIFDGVCYPGNQIPEWFDFKKEGTKMRLKSEEVCLKENVLGFTICIVVEVGKRCYEPTILCSYNITGRLITENEIYKCTLQGESHSCWLLMADNGSSEAPTPTCLSLAYHITTTKLSKQMILP